MLKKTIEFEDLDGNTVSRDYYFRLRKSDLAEMQLTHGEGLIEYLNEMVAAQNGQAIIDNVKKIIAMSVGTREGNVFKKNDQITNEFMESEAYSVLFMELCTDADAAANFVNSIVPKDLSDISPETVELQKVDSNEDARPAWMKEDRDPTTTEVAAMSKDELVLAMKRKSKA